MPNLQKNIEAIYESGVFKPLNTVDLHNGQYVRIILEYDKNYIKEYSKKITQPFKNQALAYAEDHPIFPLNWSQNKLTREEMNER